MAKRHVFFSFHYSRDVWRASQVRNMGKVDNSSTFSDNDWEKVRLKSNKEIENWIDNQLDMCSCLVVLVGNQTSERKWIKYEIQKAYDMWKGIVGIRIDRLKDANGEQDLPGSNPFSSIYTKYGHSLSRYVTLFEPEHLTSSYVYSDIYENIEHLIEEAISKRGTY